MHTLYVILYTYFIMNESKISNTEWGLVIGALFMIDGVQVGLDLFVIGLIINRFVDIFVWLSFGLYLQLRGESLANPKRLIGLVVTFLGEEIPAADALPFWGLDGLYNMFLSKSDKILSQVPGGKAVASATGINNKKAA